ncbi:MAG: transposase [Saprospiraceae bacterium]
MVNITDELVTFRYKDYRDGAKKKVMTLAGTEFLRRSCLHILPKGFRKIRSYSFVANAVKAKKVTLARNALGEKCRG